MHRNWSLRRSYPLMWNMVVMHAWRLIRERGRNGHPFEGLSQRHVNLLVTSKYWTIPKAGFTWLIYPEDVRTNTNAAPPTYPAPGFMVTHYPFLPRRSFHCKQWSALLPLPSSRSGRANKYKQVDASYTTALTRFLFIIFDITRQSLASPRMASPCKGKDPRTSGSSRRVPNMQRFR